LVPSSASFGAVIQRDVSLGGPDEKKGWSGSVSVVAGPVPESSLKVDLLFLIIAPEYSSTVGQRMAAFWIWKHNQMDQIRR